MFTVWAQVFFLQTCPVCSWSLVSFLHLQLPREGNSTAESLCLYVENPRVKYALGVHWSSKYMTNHCPCKWDKSGTNVFVLQCWGEDLVCKSFFWSPGEIWIFFHVTEQEWNSAWVGPASTAHTAVWPTGCLLKLQASWRAFPSSSGGNADVTEDKKWAFFCFCNVLSVLYQREEEKWLCSALLNWHLFTDS